MVTILVLLLVCPISVAMVTILVFFIGVSYVCCYGYYLNVFLLVCPISVAMVTILVFLLMCPILCCYGYYLSVFIGVSYTLLLWLLS